MELKDALEIYIKNTREVRSLSAVPTDIFLDKEGYYKEMCESFTKIRKYSSENQSVLDNVILPFLREEYPLNEVNQKALENAVDEMVDGYSMENLDVRFVSMCCDKLLNDAYSKDNDEYIIKALDLSITVYYTLMNKLDRIASYSGYKEMYRNNGFNVAAELMEYFHNGKYDTLSEENKKILLINSRYMSALHEGTSDVLDNSIEFGELEFSKSFLTDDHIRNSVSDYSWENHEAAIYEYYGYMTEKNNMKNVNREQAKYIYECTKKLHTLKKNDPIHVTRITDVECNLLLSRSQYVAGASTVEEYKKLLMLQFKRRKSGYEISGIFTNLLVPCEYMLVLDRNNLSDEEKDNLLYIYKNTLAYITNISASETIGYLLEYYSLILELFIEVEGMSFEEFALSGMAAFHLPTYVHSNMVALISKTLMKSYIKKYGSIEGVSDEDAIDFAYKAALVHDIGKLPIIDTVSLYERKLFDDEFKVLKTHSELGHLLLSKQERYKKYANVALSHHKWSNRRGGYPLKNVNLSLLERITASIVTCADCMDAATDNIGRSYSGGITLEKYITEYSNETGRYDQTLTPILDEAKEELDDILLNKRKEMYFSAYEKLYS